LHQPKRIQPGDRVPVRLSARERDLILDHTFIDPELERRIRVGSAEEASVTVRLTLDELIGHVAAQANHCSDARLRTRLNNLYDRLRQVGEAFTDEDLVASSPPTLANPGSKYTAKQGQYLAFIFYYTKIHGRSPSEADLRSYFKVSPPAVHRMLLTLEERGFIERKPGEARATRLLVGRGDLPDLE